RHIEKGENSNNLMERWWGNTIIDGTAESEIIPQLTEMNLPVLNKSTYDAFYNTELETLLRNRNIKWVIITGVMTDLCCETTARSAFLRGFMPIVVADATATKTEELHISALMTLAHGFAEITTTKKILENFKCQKF
ncbi:isochorismatase family protein, partial [bacterium]|nr:isochorismatase family protein [bacterium]